MKISKLLAKLEKAKEKYGDIDVCTYVNQYDGMSDGYYPIKNIKINHDKDEEVGSKFMEIIEDKDEL